MDSLLFQMPGPARFADLLEQDLRDGRNILLFLPNSPRIAVREALGVRVKENDLWEWHVIDLRNFDQGMNPLKVVSSRMSNTSIPDIAALTENPAVQGYVFWVDAVTVEQINSWKTFLKAYEHTCRNASNDRPLFCVAIAGEEMAEGSIGPACVARQWKGILDHLDIELLVAHIVRNRLLHPLEARLTISLCAELSGTDHSLAAELAEHPLAKLLDAEGILREYATRRGWKPESGNKPTWQDGSVDVVDGQPLVHSAFLAMRGERKEIQRRAWRAEVRVLFPFIEEQRVLFIERLQSILEPQMPVTLALTRVDDYRDLEIGPILWLTKPKLDSASLSLLTALYNIRIALAHLQPVSLRDWTVVQDSLKASKAAS